MNTNILSIIIICKDNYLELISTLNSIKNFFNEFDENYSFELIVIDNSQINILSKEDLIELTNGYKNLIFKHQISNGIFGAFNEGIESSSGKYLWFLNSGDQFSNIISPIDFLSKLKNSNCLAIFYQTIIYSSILHKQIGLQPIDFPKSLIIYKSLHCLLPFAFGYCHQSVIINRAYHLDNLYKSLVNIGQDSFLIDKLIKSRSVEFINKPLSTFYLGGISSSKPKSFKKFLNMISLRLRNFQISSSVNLFVKFFILRDPGALDLVRFYRYKIIFFFFKITKSITR